MYWELLASNRLRAIPARPGPQMKAFGEECAAVGRSPF